MKKIFILTAICLFAFGAYSQNKASAALIAQRIDSVCKANKIKLCSVYYRYPFTSGSISIVETGTYVYDKNFRFDDCFLIVNNQYYYDLTKLIYFEVRPNSDKPDIKDLAIYFQPF
jgi:hypothetical protein